jgi:hypothetical protein
MAIGMKHRLAGLVVATSVAATGTAALAQADDIQAGLDGSDQSAIARAHGTEISELAQELEGGPEKGAAISAAARGHGEAVSEAARSRGDDADEDVDTDEDTDADDDTRVSGKPADAGAQGLATAAAMKADGAATATAAQADGKSFGLTKAEAAKASRR